MDRIPCLSMTTTWIASRADSETGFCAISAAREPWRVNPDSLARSGSGFAQCRQSGTNTEMPSESVSISFPVRSLAHPLLNGYSLTPD
jgi:hypothetical protein